MFCSGKYGTFCISWKYKVFLVQGLFTMNKSCCFMQGLTLLTLTASVSGLRPECTGGIFYHPTQGQKAALYAALYLIAIGTGGIKPCVSSFGADQFDESERREKKSKSSFFNLFYFFINIGALIAASVLVYIQTNVGWGWGFGIPAVCMANAVVCFFFGTLLYRNQRPAGSPLTCIAQVLVASLGEVAGPCAGRCFTFV